MSVLLILVSFSVYLARSLSVLLILVSWVSLKVYKPQTITQPTFSLQNDTRLPLLDYWGFSLEHTEFLLLSLKRFAI